MTAISLHARRDRAPSAAASPTLRSMADRLVDRLGAEGAERACRDNQWGGVLAEIKNRENRTGGIH